MKILGVIPARYDSSRFPGKPLVDIGGKSMVMRVYEQSRQAYRLADVVIATDDERIFDHVRKAGGNVLMTSKDHPTGTDRVIEVAGRMPGFDGYINIQGDEPFIDPAQINQVAEIISVHNEPHVGTLVKKLEDLEDLNNPNVIKAVLANDNRAIYFSRSPIPYMRDQSMLQAWNIAHGFWQHIGIYGFTAVALEAIKGMPKGSLEEAESLEQLRWMENGIHIYAGETSGQSRSIDTPGDLDMVRAWLGI